MGIKVRLEKNLEALVADQFKNENVQKTVERAAAAEASRLLAKSVEPSIKSFQSKIDDVAARVDRRSQEVVSVVENTKKAASDIESLQGELKRLKDRNDLTALADVAISEGDVEAYRKLERMTTSLENDEAKNAALAELFRVYQAYSIFSGVSRTARIQLNVLAINSHKSKEEELDVDELLPLLNEADPLARAKVGQLISKKGPKLKSFKTSEAVYNALKKETHLEAYKVLGGLLAQVTGQEAGGKLDKREIIEWYEKNRDRLRKEDTDVTPTPSLSP
jgi:mannose/fructose/N-acetylgalactosamine-specific phosphotransferase system component IIB